MNEVERVGVCRVLVRSGRGGYLINDNDGAYGVVLSAWARVLEWLAVGGATLLLFPLSWVLRTTLGLDAAELAVGFVMFHAAHAINDPHFSVTYLLFYKGVRARAFGREHSLAQRVRYVIAGLVVPAVLVAWVAWSFATGVSQALGWMAQLMFFLVGWHYAKQGFGVLTVLSARRGIRFSPRERMVTLTHCFAAWAFAWANPARAAGEFEEKGVVYWGPAHPRWLELLTGGVFALSAVALVIMLARKWRRDGRPALTPLVGFVITIWCWTIYTAIDPLVRYVIPALHSIQYMYFVWLMTRNQARAYEGPPTFGPPVGTRVGMLALTAVILGWAMFRGGPSILDAGVTLSAVTHNPSFGDTPFFAAFFIAINIHHYFMDHVIWRRENPETAYLYAADG